MARRPSCYFSQTPLHYIVTACYSRSMQNGFSASQSCDWQGARNEKQPGQGEADKTSEKVNKDAAVLHTCRDEWRRGCWRADVQYLSSLDYYKCKGCWLPSKCSVGVDSILPYRFAFLYWDGVFSCSLAKENESLAPKIGRIWDTSSTWPLLLSTNVQVWLIWTFLHFDIWYRTNIISCGRRIKVIAFLPLLKALVVNG